MEETLQLAVRQLLYQDVPQAKTDFGVGTGVDSYRVDIDAVHGDLVLAFSDQLLNRSHFDSQTCHGKCAQGQTPSAGIDQICGNHCVEIETSHRQTASFKDGNVVLEVVTDLLQLR